MLHSKRLLHNFKKRNYSKPKIDPSRSNTLPNGIGGFDAASIRNMRKIEETMENIASSTKFDPEVDIAQDMWLHTDRGGTELERINTGMELPDVFKPDLDDKKPFDRLKLETDDGFAKAMSYLSIEKSSGEYGHPSDAKYDWNMEEVLQVGRHTKVTGAGRIFSFSALIMLGSGKASAALGYGRGPTVAQACDLARLNADKNVISLNLHRGNNIGSDIFCKYKKSFVRMKQCRTGWGTNVGWEMKQVLEAFGIEDISCSQGGPRNKATKYRAIFLGLMNGVRSKEDVSRMFGRKLFNKNRLYYNSKE